MINTNLGLIELPSADSPSASAVAKVMESLAATRRELATQWASLPPDDVQRHYADRLGQIHRFILGLGLRDALQDATDRAFIADLKASLALDDPRRANPGQLLAAMLFLCPHELPHAYELPAVPEWLMNDYVGYMLSVPPMFRGIGEAAAWCEFTARWTSYLKNAVTANVRAEFWQNIGAHFLQSANFIPLYFNTANLRDVYRDRAAIMETTLSAMNHPLSHTFGPRANRERLRLGILAAHFAPQTETYATLPVYRHLDRTKFEIILFTAQQTNHPLEQYCIKHADRFVVLPQNLGERLQTIRSADLDLIFLGTNTTAITNPITLLALYRLARVQVAGVCSCTTTGMRNIDYYLSGRLSEPPDAQVHYTEKLVMVDGPAHCYDFGGEEPSAPTLKLSRQALGIPNDAVVFVSGANFFKILPELDEIWMRVLAAVPGSRLVLYPFNPNWSGSYPAQTFMQRLSAAATRHDVDPGRLIVFAPTPDRADIFERLRVGDIYLDSFPFSGATSLLDPLTLGLPTVVKDGTSFRTLVAPALLRSMELEELIAGDGDAYVALAVKLARDAGLRREFALRIRAKMDSVPKFLDSKWYGQQATAAFARMWDESTSGTRIRAMSA